MNKTERLKLRALGFLVKNQSTNDVGEKGILVYEIKEALAPKQSNLPFEEALKEKKTRKERVKKIEKGLEELKKIDTPLHKEKKVKGK